MEAVTTEQNNPMMGMDAPKRPTFLTVLCVLSFIMCGIWLILGVWGIIERQPEKVQERIERLREVNPEMADRMEESIAEQQATPLADVAPYLNFAFLILSFLGVLLMFRLKKGGFYIYLIAELLTYPVLFLSGGTKAMSGGMGEGMGIAMLGLMVVFDIAFFVMYGANLKYMKK